PPEAGAVLRGADSGVAAGGSQLHPVTTSGGRGAQLRPSGPPPAVLARGQLAWEAHLRAPALSWNWRGYPNEKTRTRWPIATGTERATASSSPAGEVATGGAVGHDAVGRCQRARLREDTAAVTSSKATRATWPAAPGRRRGRLVPVPKREAMGV